MGIRFESHRALAEEANLTRTGIRTFVRRLVRLQYFESTDTLYIEFSQRLVVETRDLDEDMFIEFDEEGSISAITLENASVRALAPGLSYEQIPPRQSRCRS